MANIRRATLDDHEAICALWEESRLPTVEQREWTTLIANQSSVVLVAEEEGAIEGAIVVSSDGWRAYVYHVAVIPGSRRRGLAKQLFEASHTFLTEQGTHLIYVLVQQDNDAGLALLRSMGYSSEGDIAMVHQLAPDG